MPDPWVQRRGPLKAQRAQYGEEGSPSTWGAAVSVTVRGKWVRGSPAGTQWAIGKHLVGVMAESMGPNPRSCHSPSQSPQTSGQAPAGPPHVSSRGQQTPAEDTRASGWGGAQPGGENTQL